MAGVVTGFGTMNDHTITIGERDGWGNPQLFGISAVDQRQHIYVIGKTGSGKTTLLRNLILQHIALGHGVGLIDPHGDLGEPSTPGAVAGQHDSDCIEYRHCNADPRQIHHRLPQPAGQPG